MQRQGLLWSTLFLSQVRLNEDNAKCLFPGESKNIVVSLKPRSDSVLLTSLHKEPGLRLVEGESGCQRLPAAEGPSSEVSDAQPGPTQPGGPWLVGAGEPSLGVLAGFWTRKGSGSWLPGRQQWQQREIQHFSSQPQPPSSQELFRKGLGEMSSEKSAGSFLMAGRGQRHLIGN